MTKDHIFIWDLRLAQFFALLTINLVDADYFAIFKLVSYVKWCFWGWNISQNNAKMLWERLKILNYYPKFYLFYLPSYYLGALLILLSVQMATFYALLTKVGLNDAKKNLSRYVLPVFLKDISQDGQSSQLQCPVLTISVLIHNQSQCLSARLLHLETLRSPDDGDQCLRDSQSGHVVLILLFLFTRLLDQPVQHCVN